MAPASAPAGPRAARAAAAEGQPRPGAGPVEAVSPTGAVSPLPQAVSKVPPPTASSSPQLDPQSCWAGVVRSATDGDRRLAAGGVPRAVATEDDRHAACWAGVVRTAGGNRHAAAVPPPAPPPASSPLAGVPLHPRHGRRHPRRRPAPQVAVSSSAGGGSKEGPLVEPAASGTGGQNDLPVDLGGTGGGGPARATRSPLRDGASGAKAMAVGGY